MSSAGRHGNGVRSDCRIRFDADASGVQIDIQSKVKSLYGRQIEEQIRDDLKRMGLQKARITIEDAGALPFALSARLETAVRRAGVTVKSPACPEQRIQPEASPKQRLRRSRLYLPGNLPHLLINAALHEADGVILDLEDSVSAGEKDAARVMVRNALLAVDFADCERMVRINQLPMGLEDLEWVIPYGAQLILLPKCQHADQVRQVVEKIDALDPGYPVWIMPVIETTLGCFHALDIATASDRVASLTLGLQDYLADLGVPQTPEGRESLWAKSQVVNAARAAGLGASDAVYTDVSDADGLRQYALQARQLGYEGMGCIHPRQIKTVHEVFRPSRDEIDRAQAALRAYDQGVAQGTGVTAVDSKMVDAPIVKSAQKIVDLAVKLGLLDADWRTRDNRSRT
ncbi:MAG: aldolase/citrate lyase family protein [candidate division KSB1 bacterium]|nr:aldolase/citrate lyase family protein [candidate division KSB1 bacterium]